ncbi:hypothetical protein [Halobacillus litoralis]|uniref:Uncharacterized protein n=1 Tax=Halobacillus litoralis TaxID=45668 RepID=A0A410M9H9_9BACI|nr:hypothetical protein [Halobacillus litoralis]QAS51394.1 hypothetical protein HLI_03760 [Halobacillus litoralis]
MDIVNNKGFLIILDVYSSLSMWNQQRRILTERREIAVLDILISHIPSTLVHVLAGALIMNLFFENESLSQLQRRNIMLLGAAVVLVIDIPKLFGILLFHSLLFVPILALGIAFFIEKYMITSFQKLWWAFMTILSIAGIAVDFLGNGTHLFYPFMNENFSYTLIHQEGWYALALFVLLITRLYGPRFIPLHFSKILQVNGLFFLILFIIENG